MASVCQSSSLKGFLVLSAVNSRGTMASVEDVTIIRSTPASRAESIRYVVPWSAGSSLVPCAARDALNLEANAVCITVLQSRNDSVKECCSSKSALKRANFPVSASVCKKGFSFAFCKSRTDPSTSKPSSTSLATRTLPRYPVAPVTHTLFARRSRSACSERTDASGTRAPSAGASVSA